MKKTLSLILALLMSVSCASFAFAEEATDEVLLDDAAIVEEAEEAVEEEEPSLYQDAIDFLNAYGIYKGYGDSKMGANDDIQRYQMALFTSRIATGWVDDAAWNTGIWNASYTEFTDVNEAPAANYLGAISYANQNGIIEGYGDGRFGPTDGITYQNALTMVVRALGYGNLNWPWGYIEKAVNLGLTAGIVDVAYTDVLTRGEVAQVIYNALFATAKDGTTLGAKNFGIEFGWETIIITASDGAWFTGADAKANGEKKDGVVAYKVVKSNGTVDGTTYYTKASTFGFEGHEDELAVGKAFKVCFNKDGILFAKSLYVDTLWNFGPDTTEVKDYFAGKTAVSKYTETTYLDKAGKIAYKDEVIVAEGTYGTTVEWTEVNHNLLAIDWNNGNILVADEIDKDGKVLSYKVEWYYNALLDQYYDVKTKSTGKDKMDGEIEIVGINLLDEDDVAALLKKLDVKKSGTFNAYDILTSNPGYSAYASLDLFDLNGNDYGVYTSYRFGKIAQDKKGCGHADNQHVVITDLSNDIAGATYAVINGKDYASKSFNKVLAGECDKCKNNEVWWSECYAPELDEDGKIETNYVLYNFNKVTNELRVVDTLEAQTGVLRAYNLSKQTINIDGTSYSFKYDALEGNLFATTDDLNKNTATKAITGAYLKNLFNQFVEFVVVDDAIVYVRAKGNNTDNYLVVESYAGLSSDGYIVVNAYSTADLKLKQYRIGSYNGWEKGDYFYYLDDATAIDSFSKGVIYDVSSYDKENNVYYVELVGSFFENGDQTAEYVVDGISTTKDATLKLGTDGYITLTVKGETKDLKKGSSDDTFIMIGNPDGKYVPMSIYTGKIPEADWTVTGDYAKLGDHLFLFVNIDAIKGFNYDEYAASYVVYLKKATTSAKYDVYDNEDADWYLLGASTYEAIVFDLLKGEDKVVTAQNVKLVSGYTYITLDGKIVDDTKLDIDEAWAELTGEYRDVNLDSADYLTGIETFKSAWINKDGFDKKAYAADHFKAFLGLTEKHDSEIAGKVIALTINDKGLVTDWADVTKSGAKFWETAKDTTNGYGCYYVYDVKANSVVLYVFVEKTTVSAEGLTVTTDKDFAVLHDSFIEATVEYDETVETGITDKGEYEIKEIAINNITFDYIGACEKDVHGVVAANHNYFFVDTHFENFFDAQIKAYKTPVDGDKPAFVAEYHGSVVVETYDQHADEDEICNLVKTICIDVKDENGKALKISDGQEAYFEISYFAGDIAYTLDIHVTVDADGTVKAEFVNDNTYNNVAIGTFPFINVIGIAD